MSIISALPYNLTNGTTADATQVMADFNQIVNGVNSNAASNGANTNITSLGGLTTPLSQAQGGTNIYIGGTTTGSANAQVLASTSPANVALTNGNIISFTAGYSNSGAATLAVTTPAITATAININTSSGLAALVGGEIVAGGEYILQYDSTSATLVLLNPSTYLFSGNNLSDVKSAVTALSNIGGVPTSAGVAGGFINKFRNGAFDIAQRGTSGNVTTGNANYTLDGWILGATGATAGWEQVYGEIASVV